MAHELEAKWREASLLNEGTVEKNQSIRLRELENTLKALEQLVRSETNPQKIKAYKSELDATIDALREERNAAQVNLDALDE